MNAPAHAAVQLSVAAAAGAAVGVAVGVATPTPALYAVLVAWLVAVVVYLGWLWLACWHLDAQTTKKAAQREDPTRAGSDVLLLTAAVASLAGVVLVMDDAQHDKGAAMAAKVVVGILTVVASWFLVHSLYTEKYARLYYGQQAGGISFNTDEPPVWSDFAYISFTVGMTFQVSDTDLQSVAVRRLALTHMLLSYLFGAVIIAVTINTLAGITQGG